MYQHESDGGLDLIPRDRSEDRVDVLHEVERLAVEQHVLLLDAERVGIALAEGVVVHAAARREARALPRDRGGIDLAAVVLHRLSSTPPGAARRPRSRRGSPVRS